MPIPQRKGDPLMFKDDEGIRPDTTVESLARLKPAFRADGTITAGSASQISDGAAAVVVMSRAKAEELGLTWLAEIGAHGVVAGPDSTLQHQPAAAIKAACAKEGIGASDLDLVEVNEAFAAVGLASAQELGIDPEMMNVNGGAIALGHPIGMSGARLVLHLALELPAAAAAWGRPACAAAAARATRSSCASRPADHSASHLAEPETGAAASTGDPGAVVPVDLPAVVPVDLLVEQARAGRPRAVARLVSLVEDASPALREVAAALAPHTGHARVVGLTGSPGVGKSTATSALVAALRGRGQRVGVLAVDPSSPFTGGALLGDRIRMQEHALDPGVFIRSMATRGHLGGWPGPPRRRSGCSTGRASTSSSSRPSASARARSRSPGSPTSRWCCSPRGWVTACRRRRRASSRSATSSW